MPEVPKIVHQRLRATTPGQQSALQAHPQADVLNAFAEQTLSPREREDVLEHLALCEDCRDVVVLALPAFDVTPALVHGDANVGDQPVSASSRKNWLAWANLHWARLSWAALAAGIAVAVLVVRPGLEHQTMRSPATSASQTLGPRNLKPGNLVPQPAPPESILIAPTLRENRDLALDKKTAAQKSPMSSESTMVVASNRRDITPKESAGSSDRASLAQETRSLDALKQSNQTIAVSSERDMVGTSVATTDANLMARADAAPPIVKTKPAPVESETSELQMTVASAQANVPAVAGSSSASGATAADIPARNTAARKAIMIAIPSQNAAWTITEGALRRSFDNGQTWQTALRSDHVLLCYTTLGQEIWAGGTLGTLQHSIDGGATWSAIKVSFQGHPLTSDVTRIDASTPGLITLATANRENWSSADGGSTWEKR